MTIEERKAAAHALRAAGGNCAQAVALALHDVVADQVDRTALYKMTEGFGLGMGDMSGTCGALSGAIAVAGLKNSSGTVEHPTKADTYKLTKEMLRRFQEKNTALRCHDLKGINTGVMLRSCPGCIEDTIDIACEVLGIS